MARRRKRYLDNAAPADNTANVVRPVNQMIRVKQKDTPAKREKETREYQAKVQTGQRILNRFSRTPAGRRAANRAYAVESQRQKQEAAKEEAAAVVQSVLGPTLPSYWFNMLAAAKNGQVSNVTDALAAPYLSDSWSMRNPGKALAVDIATPFVLGGTSKIVKGARIPLGNGITSRKLSGGIPTLDNVKYSFGIPSFDELSNLYTRVANAYKAKQLSVVNKAHDDVIEYLGSDKNIERLINAGATKEQAERIAFDMQQNAMATKGTIGLPNSSTALGEYEPDFKVNFNMNVPIWSNESRLRPTFEPEYIVREGLPLEDTYSTVVHELGGHGATLAYNPMYGIEDPKVQKLYRETIKQWSPSTEQVYNHNGLLQPSRKPEYMNLSETDPVEKRIRYLEDVDEYSTRARASHILPSTTDMLDLYKYFTKETVDRLKNNVWAIAPFLVGGGLAAKNK